MKKPFYRTWWFRVGLVVVLLTTSSVLWLRNSINNVMHPALDTLAQLQIQERWSHPELLKIRALGKEAVNPLRRVLGEPERVTTRFLLWANQKWPTATKRLAHVPDPRKMTERRWVACQVLQTLGPAAKPAAPELIRVLTGSDMMAKNGASMALYSIGLDKEICDQLASVLEKKKIEEFGGTQAIRMLGMAKPPSPAAMKVVLRALKEGTEWTKSAACETLVQWGGNIPDAIPYLKKLEQNSTNKLVILNAMQALGQSNPGPELKERLLALAEDELKNGDFKPSPPGTSGGQGVNLSEQVIMKVASTLAKMNLEDPDRQDSLKFLQRVCEHSGRIFIKMLLLPDMRKLGYPTDQAVAVCKEGLECKENYYQIQAARLLVDIVKNHPQLAQEFQPYLKHPEIGVKVYAASAVWRTERRPETVLPILQDALDVKKYQSYYYPEVQQAVLNLVKEMGEQARPLSSTLSGMLKDPNPKVAALASDILTTLNSR